MVKLCNPFTAGQAFSIAEVHQSTQELERKSIAQVWKPTNNVTSTKKAPGLLPTPVLMS